jgi:molybdate transport system substrate-binding protein
VCLVLLCGVLGVGDGWGQKKLRVAAAADLQPVLPVLAAEYERATGVKLVVSYGSSSTLATQILNGEPMDIFLGADFVFPEKVVAAGLADTTSPVAYARGTLVLWARKDSPLQPLSMERLTDPRVKTIAIANELHAPYGRAAVSALKRLKLYDAVAPHLVVAENIAQTAQFVESGNAQLGLISLTAASSEHFKEIGTYVLVPTLYPEIRQCAVVMEKSERRVEAHAFLDWLLSPAVQGSLQKLGLRPVK